MTTAILLALALAAEPAKVPPPPPPPPPEPVLQPQCPVEEKVIPTPPGYKDRFPAPPDLKVKVSWGWTTGDYVREALVLGLISVDWHQTRHFRSLGVHELNAALGPTPSRARVNKMIAAGALAHLGIAIALPHGDWRTGWQLTVGGAEAISVYNNARQGY